MDIVSQIAYEEAEFVNVPKESGLQANRIRKGGRESHKKSSEALGNLAPDQPLGFFVRF
jgi:hypothetical protein